MLRWAISAPWGSSYSTFWCHIHQTYTSCLSWHDLLMSYDGLCPSPIFHASLTMVRKKWLSLYTVPMGATFTKLTPAVHLDVYPWPIFHASLTIVRKKWLSLFSSPEPKAQVSYCHSAPSVVRPSVRPSSVRKLFTFSTSSPEPLDGFWWNLVWMKYSWSLTSVVVFRTDPPRGGSRAGPK